jgi:hypothetical protein
MIPRLGFTREPWRWALALWLALVLLSPEYRWARYGALSLLVGFLIGTTIATRRAVRAERQYIRLTQYNLSHPESRRSTDDPHDP